jgi:hypothetical protein
MAGGIFGALLMVLVYGLFVILNKTAHHRLLD